MRGDHWNIRSTDVASLRRIIICWEPSLTNKEECASAKSVLCGEGSRIELYQLNVERNGRFFNFRSTSFWTIVPRRFFLQAFFNTKSIQESLIECIDDEDTYY